MALRRKQCRAHGGIFSYHPKRGRQPVSCKPETPCDRADSPPDAHEASDGAYLPSATVKPSNPSLPLAMAAKERLEAVGWVVKGRGWRGELQGLETEGWWAEITASRDQETLIMRWCDGEIIRNDYSMEFKKPSQNNYPVNDLHFDPAELSDSELVRMIKGMKVTWWNTIAGSKETAVAGGNITVEHIFFANGDEDNSKRIVKFIDHGGGGFRAFHVSALLKVG